jgi:hypothetical protein
MLADIKDKPLKVLDSCVPSPVSSSRFSQPLINKDINQLSRRKKRAYVSYVRAKSTESHKSKKRYEDLKKKD